MKKFGVLLLAAILAAALTGCGRWGILSHDMDDLPERLMDQRGGFSLPDGGSAPQADSGASESEPGGYTITGEPGDVMSTCFFDFTVKSAAIVADYGGKTADDGEELLDTVIEVKNTYGSALPMSIYDFQIQWGDGDEDFDYEDDDFWGADGAMPESYQLKDGQSVTYHVVFSVPADSTDFSVSYLERFSDDTTGDVYFVYFTADPSNAA